MKCERCGKELSDIDLYCQRCGKAVFPEYMDEDDVWAFYKSDEELIEILKEEGVQEKKLLRKRFWNRKKSLFQKRLQKKFRKRLRKNPKIRKNPGSQKSRKKSQRSRKIWKRSTRRN